jgi:hypothetical protein
LLETAMCCEWQNVKMVDQHGKSKSSALALNFSVGRGRLLVKSRCFPDS